MNQRIEAFWSILQRDRIGWWRCLFQDLVDLELFTNDDPVQLDCLRYCFMRLLRNELNTITEDWNTHIISSSRNQGPRGRPDTMYFLPHLYEKEDFKTEVSTDEINDFYPAVTTTLLDVSPEFQEFARCVISDHGTLNSCPNNASEAIELYIYLLKNIRDHS